MKRTWLFRGLVLGTVSWLACDYVARDPVSAEIGSLLALSMPTPGSCPHKFVLKHDLGVGHDADRNGDCAVCQKVLRNGATVSIDNNVGGPAMPGAHCPTKKP